MLTIFLWSGWVPVPLKNSHLSGCEGMVGFKVALVLIHIGLAQDERHRERE